jgi:iron complex transport system permease protein
VQTRAAQTGTVQIPVLPAPVGARVIKALAILTLILLASVAVGLAVGSQRIHPASLFADSFSRTLFFRLRLPRVLMGMVIGASLAVTGGALQALFRNPLADPYTLGVSGGGALGASIAIALGWSARVAGIPLVFAASFAGAMLAVSIVRTIALGEDLRIVLPGSLLLGAAFLILADALARTALSSSELPVGAITGLLGGPVFLWLLRRRQQYGAM